MEILELERRSEIKNAQDEFRRGRWQSSHELEDRSTQIIQSENQKKKEENENSFRHL